MWNENGDIPVIYSAAESVPVGIYDNELKIDLSRIRDMGERAGESDGR